MKQFLTVFRFEFKNYAKNKVFIAITLLAILLLGGVLLCHIAYCVISL